MGDGARPATAADLEAVATLAREAIAELGQLRGGTIWRLRDARQEPLEPALGALLARSDPETTAVAGTFDGTVVGYGVSRLETLADGDRLAVVEDLYVHPEARGVGVGEAMMDLLVARAVQAGAIGIDALALPGDRNTKNFFETFGLKARALVVHKSLGER
jgi:ribosomal protein S18 acetylase RimI-like enzyme